MHITDNIVASLIGAGAMIITARLSNRFSKRSRADEKEARKQRYEVLGRRQAAEESKQAVDGYAQLVADLRIDLDRLSKDRDDDRREVAQLRRDVAKEQRRSNALHERIERLLQWLKDNGIQVPTELLTFGAFDGGE
jgi:predicted RNase H-like nuclease (RuvC/YqgF family)